MTWTEAAPVSSRLLGEDFVPPRALYLTHIPALLILTGLVTWIAGDEPAMVVAAFVGGITGIYMMYDWLLQEGPTRFSTIMALTLLMGYGLGAVNTWVTLPRGGLTIAQFMGHDEGVFARGMAAVLIASAPLCFLGELYERPLFGREFRVPRDQSTYVLILLGTLAIVVGFFTKSIGFMGGQTVYGEQQSVATALLPWMFPPITALSIGIMLATPRGFARLLSGACAVVLCVLIMVMGRRNIFYTIIESLFCLRLVGYRLRGSLIRKAFLLIGLGFFLAVGVTAFMLLRLASYENPHNPDKSLIGKIQIAMSWVEDGTAVNRATEANENNAQTRTFLLEFFSDVLEGSMNHTPALGRDLAGYVQYVIPRVFYPEKDLTFAEEGLDDELFGLTYRDASNSILTNGATDFGLLGIIAYPMMIVVLFRFSINVFSRFLPPLSLTIITLGILFSLLQTENAVSAYLDTLRSAVIFAIVLLIYSRIPRIQLRST